MLQTVGAATRPRSCSATCGSWRSTRIASRPRTGSNPRSAAPRPSKWPPPTTGRPREGARRSPSALRPYSDAGEPSGPPTDQGNSGRVPHLPKRPTCRDGDPAMKLLIRPLSRSLFWRSWGWRRRPRARKPTAPATPCASASRRPTPSASPFPRASRRSSSCRSTPRRPGHRSDGRRRGAALAAAHLCVGLSPGMTDAVFFDAAGRRILTLNIRVDQDFGAVAQTISGDPGCSRSHRGDQRRSILSGDVPNLKAADKAVQIAQRSSTSRRRSSTCSPSPARSR